jgi:hypothetical protein
MYVGSITASIPNHPARADHLAWATYMVDDTAAAGAGAMKGRLKLERWAVFSEGMGSYYANRH